MHELYRDDLEIRHHAKVLWNFCSCRTEIASCDYIIALGCRDLDVALHAAELFHRKIAPLVIASGGKGRFTSNDPEPEAEKFRKILIQQEVPDNAILTEVCSSNTKENIRNLKEIFRLTGKHIKKATLVTQPFSVRRALKTAALQWKDVAWQADCKNITFEEYAKNDLYEAARRLSGEIYRLEKYAIKDEILTEFTPSEILKSYFYFRDINLIS